MAEKLYTMTIRNFFIKGWFDYDFEIDRYSFEHLVDAGAIGKVKSELARFIITKPSNEFSHIFWEQFQIETYGGVKTIFPAATISTKVKRNGKFSEGYLYEFFELEVVNMITGVRQTEEVWFKFKDVSFSSTSNL